MGLRGGAVDILLGDDLVISVQDVTGEFNKVGRCLEAGDLDGANSALPADEVFTELPTDVKSVLILPGMMK